VGSAGLHVRVGGQFVHQLLVDSQVEWALSGRHAEEAGVLPGAVPEPVEAIDHAAPPALQGASRAIPRGVVLPLRPAGQPPGEGQSLLASTEAHKVMSDK
jgi:hypothetical protein